MPASTEPAQRRRVHRLGDADPSRRRRDAVRDRVGGGDGGDVMETHRDPVGAEEDGDDREPRQVAAELRQDEPGEGAVRAAQDRAAGGHLAAQLLQPRPEGPHQQRHEEDGAGEDQEDQPGMVFEEAELDPEGAADAEEEVEVEGDVEDREGDLLDDDRREHHRQRRRGEQGREHQQHHPGAEVGRQEGVEGDGDRVAGEDQPVGDAFAGQRRAQDPVPGERRQRRLRGLQHHPGDHRPEGDLADLAQQFADPVGGRDAEQVEDEEDQADAADPDRDPRQPSADWIRLWA